MSWTRHRHTSGYHGISFGHLVAELIRRVTGADVTELLRIDMADLGKAAKISLLREGGGTRH